jgi:hypothetical protein
VGQIKITHPKPTPINSLMRLFLLSLDGQAIEVDSNKQPQEIISTLTSVVDTSFLAWMGFSFSKSKYAGQVSGTSFQIYWKSGGRNSWRPVLSGTVEAIPEGSKIHGYFDLHPLAKFAIIVWMFIVLNQAAFSLNMHDSFGTMFMLCMAFGGILTGHLVIFLTSKDHCEKLIGLFEQITVSG